MHPGNAKFAFRVSEERFDLVHGEKGLVIRDWIPGIEFSSQCS